MRYYQFEFGVDGYVSLGSRYGWVLTINQLYPYLPFIFRSRARNGRFKKVFSCFVFNFFIEVLKTHVVLDYLNPAYQAAARPASFTRVFRAYYLGQSYLTVGFLFDRSAIRRLAGWTKMDPSQAEPKEISFPCLEDYHSLFFIAWNIWREGFLQQVCQRKNPLFDSYCFKYNVRNRLFYKRLGHSCSE